MGLKNTYRIINCKEYNDERNLKDHWWEVECFTSTWWSFGKKFWVTEKQSYWSTGGDFYIPIRFTSEQDAFDYIGRISKNIPKNKIIREPATSFI